MVKIKLISGCILLSCLYLSGCGESKTVSPETTATTTTSPNTNTGSSSSTNAATSTGTGDPSTTDPNTGTNATTSSRPNILLIISDDQGLDASSQYSLSNDLPKTPILDALASNGLVFDNAWATPGCTTTRSSIITGKHGINTGVLAIGDALPESETILHKYLADNAKTSDYQSALIGKWHLGGANPSASQPNDRGVPYYAGILAGALNDYSNWNVTEQAATSATTDYSTSKLTDLAVNWVDSQGEKPWFLWLAYNAPHTPFHLPPQSLQSSSLSGDAADITANPRAYYLAAIEAMDTEIGRLLGSMPAAVRENTIVLFVGDNGTPSRVRDRNVYANSTKSTLSEGGLRVPMIVSGKGVSRAGQRESALIGITDFFATIAELAGAETTQVNNSISFKSLLSEANLSHRNQVFVEFDDGSNSGYAIKNNQYKYLRYADGTEYLYDLSVDAAESNNLMGSGTNATQVAASLKALADELRGQNSGTPTTTSDTLDITNATLTQRTSGCADYVKKYSSTVNDIGNGVTFNGAVEVKINGSGSSAKCIITSNGIPNHDFNDGGQAFPNNVASQSYQYEIPLTPSFAATTTDLRIGIDNGIMLNGTKIDILAAACHGVGNEKIGCGNGNDWRFDPLHTANGFRLDNHNAHTQPDGSYHYHGNPKALFSDSPVESPLIGFAADGFPIFGSWFNDGSTIKKAQSSYRIKSGSRPTENGAPGGVYDGTFRDDYEYVSQLGDLDECNGMTLNGVYGYYVTETFPYLMGCFKGNIDASF